MCHAFGGFVRHGLNVCHVLDRIVCHEYDVCVSCIWWICASWVCVMC